MRLRWMRWVRLRQSEAQGFTLIEVLVAIVIVGILSAIATPSWLGFIRQQRVSSINEDISLALREAQQKARATKIAQAVSVRINDDGLAQVAVHRKQDDIDTLTDATWKNLGSEKGVAGADAIVFSNLDPNVPPNNDEDPKIVNQKNESITDGSYPQPTSQDDNGPVTIAFNQFGSLDNDSNPELKLDLIIGVGVPAGSNATKPVKDSERCIKVKTLLGAMELGVGEEECKLSE